MGQDEFSTLIEEAVASPQQASADGVSVQQRPIKDVIDAENHEAAKRAGRSSPWGLRLAKITPPGAG